MTKEVSPDAAQARIFIALLEAELAIATTAIAATDAWLARLPEDALADVEHRLWLQARKLRLDVDELQRQVDSLAKRFLKAR
ncbi:hypothetical protein [Antrihabitans cavernicola]|uniref:Uncharacterized protein n=1 Tax=Antrihabitans cavernicola TaxID=2495913 RepID=A0A5A7S4U4_9NOCA|nr:hypothetical protein [Spelaeibacter cavernicola]KAA0020107.1 hypothetical protein FOY51_21115 [Spelaeibacter cavernicola]